MDTDINFGQMVPVTKVNGLMIRQMVLGNYNMQMETYTRVNGVMTRPMARELIRMPTEHFTTETGWKTSSMASAWSPGQMVPSMKASTETARKTVKAN